jgi:Bromodomain
LCISDLVAVSFLLKDLQAQDRAHRIGQRSDVSVFRLCSNSPVEEKILSRATEKLNVAELVVESGKFNKDSLESDHSLERKRLMEILLTDFNQSTQSKSAADNTGSDDEDGDDAGSDSSEKEDLNELLSNNEADYQLYAAFDVEQAKLGICSAPLYTKDEDIPDWIRYPPVGPGSGAGIFASVADGSSRKRKDVAYDDGLTERQFMRMMDKQSMTEEQPSKKIKPGRGRKKKLVPLDVNANPTVETSPLPVSGNSDLTDWTFRKLISCGKSVVALKDPSTKRRLSDIFLEKPDPATFPDYYELIEKPIAINDILRKCRAKVYDDILEFKDDWKLMFKNAKQFNGEGSWVVEDARALERELDRVMKKNGFVDDQKPPTSKATMKKKLVIKFSLKGINKNTEQPADSNNEA